MSEPYTKLFSSITESTVWGESYSTRIVWVTMLAMADANGCVYGSVPGLVRRANVTREECETALRSFLNPDPDSRTPEFQGRRIEAIDGGWRLLNHAKYREIGARPNNYGQLLQADGYVYYAGSESRVKIGFSKNPWARISTLRTAMPSIDLLGIERGGMALEKKRHEQFEHARLDGEWFHLADDLLALIQSLERPNGDRTARGTVRAVATSATTVATTNQYPYPTPEEKKGGKPPALTLPDWLDAEVWREWHNFRNSRKGWTQHARKLSLSKLAELRSQGHDPRTVVEQSIERGWTGLFPVSQPRAVSNVTPRLVAGNSPEAKDTPANKIAAEEAFCRQQIDLGFLTPEAAQERIRRVREKYAA